MLKKGKEQQGPGSCILAARGGQKKNIIGTNRLIMCKRDIIFYKGSS